MLSHFVFLGRKKIGVDKTLLLLWFLPGYPFHSLLIQDPRETAFSVHFIGNSKNLSIRFDEIIFFLELWQS